MTLADLRGQTFAALRGPNFRRYITGHAIAMVGRWMQIVAQSWLVLELTGSGTAIGLVLALQTVPMLILGPYGGVVADRADKRKLLVVLQVLMGLQALILGVLVISDTVALWHVYVLATALGFNQCFENPVRQAFTFELVGPKNLRNAVALQSVLISCSRMIGPAVAGVIIAAGGIGLCFLLNAASVVAVVLSLLTLDTSRLRPSPPAARAKGQLREGFAYIRGRADLAVPLLMMALIGCLAFEFQVVLPIVTDQTFQAGAGAYGLLTSAMGAGSIVGGLAIATWGRTGTGPIVLAALGFGASLTVSAIAPNLAVLIVLMVVVGALSVMFTSITNSTLQLAAEPTMRGRVMALFSVAFMGSTAIGAPIAGWVSEQWGGRAGLLLGAGACFVAAAMGAAAMRRRKSAEPIPAPAD